MGETRGDPGTGDAEADRPTVVVGAGQAGLATGYHLSALGLDFTILADDPDRRVWLADRDTGRLPRKLLGRDVYRFLVPTLYRPTRRSFLDRRLHRMTPDRGDPVFEPQFEAMEAAGIERVSRIDGIEDGRPVSADGESFDVANVVWATRFRPHFPWIDLDVFDDDGEPRHTRGVVEEAPGLYFVGRPWLHRLSSSLIGGVGRDAEHVAGNARERVS